MPRVGHNMLNGHTSFRMPGGYPHPARMPPLQEGHFDQGTLTNNMPHTQQAFSASLTSNTNELSSGVSQNPWYLHNPSNMGVGQTASPAAQSFHKQTQQRSSFRPIMPRMPRTENHTSPHNDGNSFAGMQIMGLVGMRNDDNARNLSSSADGRLPRQIHPYLDKRARLTQTNGPAVATGSGVAGSVGTSLIGTVGGSAGLSVIDPVPLTPAAAKAKLLLMSAPEKKAKRPKPTLLYTETQLAGMLTSDQLLVRGWEEAEEVAIRRAALELPLGVKDDYLEVRMNSGAWILELASRFKKPASDKPPPGPHSEKPKVQVRWRETNATYKAKCNKEILGTALVPAKLIQARCALALEAAYDAHEKGPWDVSDAVVATGPDLDLTCSARILAMADLIE
nr:hypothetical protein B0A51_02820 [Rachicladosporium sp. CCFEE 5018]